ncbi:MAG: hypothetical protein EXQ52_08945 [Bryobacterales bacterium]|nr:hypothetical protein [Bryobacterales bacterium]
MSPAAPALFTVNGADPTQPGAILNQDGSLNGAASRARRGSVVQIFATGQAPAAPPRSGFRASSPRSSTAVGRPPGAGRSTPSYRPPRRWEPSPCMSLRAASQATLSRYRWSEARLRGGCHDVAAISLHFII